MGQLTVTIELPYALTCRGLMPILANNRITLSRMVNLFIFLLLGLAVNALRSRINFAAFHPQAPSGKIAKPKGVGLYLVITANSIRPSHLHQARYPQPHTNCCPIKSTPPALTPNRRTAASQVYRQDLPRRSYPADQPSSVITASEHLLHTFSQDKP